MKIRYYDEQGNEIKTKLDPAYLWRNNPFKEKPKDYVMIKQLEIQKMTTDPNGEPMFYTELSEPVEETYYRWDWQDGMWYVVCCLIMKKGTIVKGGYRCPKGWKFVENFNMHRPNLMRNN